MSAIRGGVDEDDGRRHSFGDPDSSEDERQKKQLEKYVDPGDIFGNKKKGKKKKKKKKSNNNPAPQPGPSTAPTTTDCDGIKVIAIPDDIFPEV